MVSRLCWFKLEKFGSDPKVRSLNYALIAIAALGQFSKGIMLLFGELKELYTVEKYYSRIYYTLLGQEGRILAKFFCVFLWTETKARSIKTQKRTRPILIHLDRTSLVNVGFIMWRKRELILVGSTREIPIGQDSCRSRSQSEHGIGFIFPARGLYDSPSESVVRRRWENDWLH